jgi:acyl carrier protein
MKEKSFEVLDTESLVSTLRSILAPLVKEVGLTADDIHVDSSLIEDLLLDSLRFVDLMGAIAAAFDLDEFPMQAWVDSEQDRDGKRFTVSSLADACKSELARARRT